MVEFDDLVACNDGPSSGLKQAYDMLGEKFDAANCQALMQNNVEDMGLAASESNFKAEQGFKSWFYGYRELSGGKLSDFRHLNFSRPIANGGNEKEFIGPKQDGTFDEIYSIRRNYQRPAIPDRKKDLAYAACRQWHADTESANVKITLSAYGVPGRCDKDAKLVMKLLKDGSEVLHEKEIELTNNGEASPPPYEANVITGLPKGTVLELCLEPRARVCEGLGVRMVVNRHGPPRSKKPAER
ncbi:hypothetical protein DFJ74DRAFT_690890 [Hyaloraphidium curvatum]|nr:hypothetical protein DFJ74DRAFT_690890 [Hyaloraphidium curvatum]